ncbi:enoyl-CoA hydratase/carnithine racemase [Arthrobacter pigmenti]|uniref:Enoyl-CoA hydratase/carnithine racemase n=1 Tax=Arthrobacter pigmenti TaxID=271432 RepID=A0A846RT56_9MICC|nr:enoyl-CoA hydratase-related protein [Arthrobacter pigmenti]NJC21481.1 enoyl-CoA hydratase/carnithine racemase [Arthrobacter pigmenti]
MASTTTQAPPLASLQLDQDIAVVTIENPPLNLLSRTAKNELLEIFLSLRFRDDVRAVVLRGSGTKAFSAGADIREFPQRIADGNARQISREGHRLILAVQSCGKPSVAVVDGVAFGAGLELILAADFRMATHRASFALPEASRGVFPGNGGTQLLPRIVGPARALELMLSTTPIDAAEAHRIGLVNRLVSSEDPMSEALHFARHLASLPTTAVESIRQLVRTASETTLTQGLELEAQLFAEVFRTDAVREGIEAFREKRLPDFRGAEEKNPR